MRSNTRCVRDSLTRGLACLRRQQSETTSEVLVSESHRKVITP